MMDRLLELLKANARLTKEEIAAHLGLTEDQVSENIAQLESNGSILGYHAVVNHDKLGRTGVTALIEMRITPESGGGFDRIARRIAQYEQVRSCYLMSGAYDLMVIVEGKDLYDVARFVAEKLSTLGMVLSTATHFQLRAYKHDGFLMNVDSQEDRIPVSP